MDGSGTRRAGDGGGPVAALRTTALCADGVGVVVALLGHQDTAAWVGLLAVLLRCVAELRDRPARR